MAKCKTGYEINPNTGRCIKIGGPTWKKLYPNGKPSGKPVKDVEEKKEKKCKKGYEVNPDTGRCIKVGGPTWKKLHSKGKSSPKRKSAKRKSSPKRRVSKKKSPQPKTTSLKTIIEEEAKTVLGVGYEISEYASSYIAERIFVVGQKIGTKENFNKAMKSVPELRKHALSEGLKAEKRGKRHVVITPGIVEKLTKEKGEKELLFLSGVLTYLSDEMIELSKDKAEERDAKEYMKERKRRMKDAGITQPRTAYQFFVMDKRSELERKHRDWSAKKIQKEIGKLWNKKDDFGTIYEIEADKDKKRYDREANKWYMKHPQSDDDEDIVIKKEDVKKALQDDKEMKRLFLRSERKRKRSR